MMPPPMMTARALEGRSGILSELLEIAEGALEAREIFGSIGAVVEIQRGMDLGDHAPHRLAQQRGALHRVIAAEQVVIHRALEIALQHLLLVLRQDFGVGAEIAEIEQRRVEAS